MDEPSRVEATPNAQLDTLGALSTPILPRPLSPRPLPPRPLSPLPVKRNPIPPVQSTVEVQGYAITRSQSERAQTSTQTIPMNTNIFREPETVIKPFIGPIFCQHPPPNKPLPSLPANARIPPGALYPVHRSDCSKSEMADKTTITGIATDADNIPLISKLSEDVTPIKERLSSVASTSNTSQKMTEDNAKSVKSKRPSLRNKISALFGDATVSPAAKTGTSSLSTYRPISLLSHESDTFSFSDVLDDMRKAASSSNKDPKGPAASPAQMPWVDTGAQSPNNSLRMSSAVTLDQRASSASATSQRSSSRFFTRWSQVSVPDASNGQGLSASRESKQCSYGPLAIQCINRSLSTSARRPGGALNNHTAPRSAVTPQSTAAYTLPTTSAAAPSSIEQPFNASDCPLQNQKALFSDAASKGSPGAASTARRGTLSSIEDFYVAPLKINRRRPKQTAIVTPNAPHPAGTSTEPLSGCTTRHLTLVPDIRKNEHAEVDVDPEPAFDRTVDVVWYRYASRTAENLRSGGVPRLPKTFYHVSIVFMVRYSQGRQTDRFEEPKRFRYFDLDANIRHRIMDKLLEDYRPGKPVLLNKKSRASPAWPDDFFATLWDVLGPLQSYIRACPHLRADVMAALLMTQPFHVIFSPYVKPSTEPLATKWFFEYAYFMQDVRVELDMTKLGFGLEWEASGMSLQLSAISNLVEEFVNQTLKRCPRRNPLTWLTLYCRRYFGYRQGANPLVGDKVFYRSDQTHDEYVDEKKPPFVEGQPRNLGSKVASLPPSANNPRSGHRRHHTYALGRVPFLHEAHMSVADSFSKLAGRVWIVRMVGFSEKWTLDNHQRFWPQAEFDALSADEKRIHLDRYTPSRHTDVAPGHALYLDYGVRAGIHRYPPLPDSEPMVCTGYDEVNDLFIEVGSGNILTVIENSVELIARAKNPPILRSDLPVAGGPPVPLESLQVRPSRIPRPVAGVDSLSMQAMRHGTPIKALKLLGIPYNSDLSSFTRTPADVPTKEGMLTPTKTRSMRLKSQRARITVSRHTSAEQNESAETSAELDVETGTRSPKPRVLSVKKSLLNLISNDRQKNTK